MNANVWSSRCNYPIRPARLYDRELYVYLKDILTTCGRSGQVKLPELLPHKWMPA